MRVITKFGWERIQDGFSNGVPIGDAAAFWEWASGEGSGFRLAAWFILASADACASDFDGEYRQRWIDTRESASPLRLARALDDTRKALVADFIVNAHWLVK